MGRNTHLYEKRRSGQCDHPWDRRLTQCCCAGPIGCLCSDEWNSLACRHIFNFGASAIVLYTSSTLLHSLRPGRVKNVFEILDHSSIYFFIAGTYTPFVLIAVKGGLGWTLFGIVWGLAIAGTVFKLFFVKKFLHVSTLLYILMGWLIVLAWSPLSTYMTTGGMQLLVAGGILYTVGAVFYVWRGFKYHHALWHLFVLAGSITHFFSVATLV